MSSKKDIGCNLCGKEMTFSPSLAERAKKFGKTVAELRSTFTMHSDCTLELQRIDIEGAIVKYPKSKYTQQLKSLGCYDHIFKKLQGV